MANHLWKEVHHVGRQDDLLVGHAEFAGGKFREPQIVQRSLLGSVRGGKSD